MSNQQDAVELIFADYDTGRCNVAEAMDRVDQVIQDERREARKDELNRADEQIELDWIGYRNTRQAELTKGDSHE